MFNYSRKGSFKMNQNENNPLVTIDPDTGEIYEAPSSLDQIARKSTGGLTGLVKTSYDMTTENGRMNFDILRTSNPPADHKQNEGWYGRTFNLEGYVCSGYLGKRDKTGQMLRVPEARIRTAIRDTEGKIMTS